MDDKQAFFVRCIDGKTFKMVIRGDLGKLTVGKIRRYLKSYGVQDGMQLLFNGLSLADEQVGSDFGLCNGATLHLGPPSFSETAVPQRTHGQGFSDEAAGSRTGDPTDTPHSSLSGDSRERNLKADSTHRDPCGGLSHADPARGTATYSGGRYNVDKGIPVTATSATKTNIDRIPSADLTSHSGFPVALEVENQQLREQVELLRREVADLRQKNKAPRATVLRQDLTSIEVLQSAKSNLQELAEELGVPLQFDMNFTCVVGDDESHTVLVTFDCVTERLYIYSTLLTQIPHDGEVRAKLYELLLEGSLLSREVCGGGIGISPQNGLVLLSTTIPLRHCNSSALKDIMPVFVETVARWRSLINELLN
ncbi:Tir chaperone protein (CesT) family [Trypanosoma brucei equiperdum]|uniref:Tir chaperone protein (CesT) family n=1 Tax=Trypanosoma brucei equiperdum TaxID=630700 RepID=A0A3L6L127_9TRYP|nr:Tir chaperone protein (CesT) family [Trypanosoma brucei equiperdum]